MAVALTTTVVVAVGASPAQASSTLVNAGVSLMTYAGNTTGMVLDIAEGATTHNTPLIDWPATGRDNQKFNFYGIVGSNNDYVITTFAGMCLASYPAEGRSVIQDDCNGNPSLQYWHLEEDYNFWSGETVWKWQLHGTNLCMDVAGDSPNAHTQVIVWPCGDFKLNQEFIPYRQ